MIMPKELLFGCLRVRNWHVSNFSFQCLKNKLELKESKCCDKTTAKMSGNVKDKTNGIPIIEIYRLISNVYSIMIPHGRSNVRERVVKELRNI